MSTVHAETRPMECVNTLAGALSDIHFWCGQLEPGLMARADAGVAGLVAIELESIASQVADAVGELKEVALQLNDYADSCG